jgi:hypothetical protein
MRKPDWRDSWIITALCTVEGAMYVAQDWVLGFHRWAAMWAVALVGLTLFGVYKAAQKRRNRNAPRP